MIEYEIVSLGQFVIEDLGISSGRRQESVVLLREHMRANLDRYEGVTIGKQKGTVPRDPKLIELSRNFLKDKGMYEPPRKKDHQSQTSCTAYLSQYMSGQEVARARRIIAQGIEGEELDTRKVSNDGHNIYIDNDHLKRIDHYLKGKGFVLKKKIKKDKLRRSEESLRQEQVNPEILEEQRYMAQRTKTSQTIDYKDAPNIDLETRIKLVERLREEIRASEEKRKKISYSATGLTQVFAISTRYISKEINNLTPLITTNKGMGFEGNKVLRLAELVLEEQRQLEGK